MLILSRKKGQSIVIGENIVVTVKEIRGRNVKLSIETPPNIPVFRHEIFLDIAEETKRAASQAPSGNDLPLSPELKLEKPKLSKEEL